MNFKSHYKYIFKRAFKFFAATFSFIGFIGIFIPLNIVDLFGGKVLDYILPIIFIMGLYFFVLVLIFLFITQHIFTMHLKHPDDDFWKKRKYEVDMECNKGLYVYRQIELIKEAKTSVWCSIHSLSDENKKTEYKDFDLALEKATDEIKKVRVLAPCGIERAQGAYQLARVHHVDIRFAKELEMEDLRFVLVDGKKVVFSQQKPKINGLSGDFSNVESWELGKLLENYLNEIWNDPSRSLSYEQYLVKCVNDLFHKPEDIDFVLASKRLNVPPKELERAFECEKRTYN